MHKSKKNMITIGSRVKFLHSTGTGIVRSIKGNIANVDVDGFEIPALLSDIVDVPVEAENAAIVKIGPSDPKHQKQRSTSSGSTTLKAANRYGKISIEADYEDDEPSIDVNHMKRQYAASVADKVIVNHQAIKPKVEAAPYEDTEYTVKLAFVPNGKGKPESLDLDAYIVNDSSYEVYYCVAIWRSGYVETIKTGLLEADTKELLRQFPRSSFAQIQTLHISLLPMKRVNYVPQSVENFDIELHPLKFIRPGNYAENDYFDESSFIFSLTDEHSSQGSVSVPLSEESKPVVAHKPKANLPAVEDLHIENILESCEGLSSGEILSAQLARFKFVMETAIKSSQRGKIVFIHGVGKGKLKYELKKTLDREYSKFRYQDASFAEYGYGAIMVFL